MLRIGYCTEITNTSVSVVQTPGVPTLVAVIRVFMAEVPRLAVVAAAAIVLTVLAVQEARAARILMVQLSATRSHKIFQMAIAENLAKRNHTVSGELLQKCLRLKTSSK